ncbi:MAG: hypothetical protein KIT18_03775 [Burkholderiales bacterium]|nr:hypothetical protein [Burkholderiales bacterium]
MKIVAAFLLSLALPAAAATIEGRVVGVTDGDTITILDHQNVQHRVRVASIDAPERKQPYYSRSKEHLSKWVPVAGAAGGSRQKRPESATFLARASLFSV